MKQIEHNTVPWRIATNRHTNCDGTSWGWIEGAPGHVCWSNERGSGTDMNREQAGKLVQEHNAWLERQRPVELRLNEAMARLVLANRKVADALAQVEQARSAQAVAAGALTRLEMERDAHSTATGGDGGEVVSDQMLFPNGIRHLAPKIRVARVTLDGTKVTMPAADLADLDAGEDDHAYTVRFETMLVRDFEALGDFNGF